MTTTTTTPTDPRPRAASRERTVDVELIGQDPAALVRVLTMLRRRQCVVTRVDFHVADPHRPGWLTITLTAPPAHGHAVTSWLTNLVDVASARAR